MFGTVLWVCDRLVGWTTLSSLSCPLIRLLLTFMLTDKVVVHVKYKCFDFAVIVNTLLLLLCKTRVCSGEVAVVYIVVN